MAEDVGSLVVKVAMDNSSFQQGVQNLNRSMKVIQSEFKNATSGLKDHGNGLDGLKSKQEMLSKSIDVQSKIVQQYKDKLKESKDTLSKNAEAQAKLKEKVEAAKSAYEQSKNTLGENNQKTKELKHSYEELSGEYTRNEERLRNNSRTVDNYTVRVNNAESRLNSMQRELGETTVEIDRQSSRWHVLSQQLGTIGNRFQTVGKKMSSIGKDMTMKISAPIAALGVGSAKAAIDFESAFAGVKKTVNGTKEQFANLEKGITGMSKKLPTSASDIAHVAESAGQLGIKTPNILGFTKTIIDLGNATNLVGEEGASQLAKFANITSMSQKDFDRLGSTIVSLGNNMATTEADIVAMGMRLAGAGHQVGMSEAQIMGLSAALSSVGIEAEAGGSAMSKVMVEMQLAVEKGGQSLNDFAKVSGMSASQFKTAFKQDATSALTAFMKGLSQSEKQGTSAIKVLDDMGITEVRMRDALLRAAGAGDLFNKSINIGTQAWQENTALQNEANQRYATTESQLKIVKNQIVDSARTIGANLLPAIRDIAQKIAEVTKKFSQLSPEAQKSIVKFGALALAIGPVVWVGGKIATTIGVISKAFSTVTGAIAVAKTGATAATPAIGALAKVFALLNIKIVLIAAAIGGLIYVGKKVHDYFSSDCVKSVDLFANKTEKTAQRVKAANGQMVTVYGQTTTKISEGTKKALKSYMELDKGATKSLTNLYTNGIKITQKSGKQLQDTYNQMNTQIKKGIDKQHQDRIKGIQKFFANSKSISAKEKNQILAKEQQHNAKMQSNQQTLANKINSIIQNAASKNRQLKTEEVKEIEVCQQQMQENAVKHLSKSETESKVIMERVKSYNGRMSAEQASEVIKNAESQRVKTVDEANKQFLETKSNIENMRDVTGSITKEQADKMIKEAEKQRDGSVKKAGELKQGVVTKVKEMNSDVIKDVDTSDGHIKSTWEKTKETVSTKAQEMKSAVVTAFEQKKKEAGDKCSEIKSTVSTKWNEIVEWFNTLPSRLREKAHTMFENMRQGINEKMASVKQSATDIGESIKNAFTSIPENMLTIGHNIMEGLKNGIRNKINDVKEAASEVARAAEERVKTALGIHSPSRVMMELGKYTSQGLALGILEDLDKVEKAATLAAQTIKDITEGKLSDVKIKTNTNDREMKDRLGRQLNWGANNKAEYQKYLEFINRLNKEEVEKSKEFLKEDYENRVKSVEDRLRILKNENSIELQTEKSRIDSQIAYYQKLQRNTKDKKSKTNYANQIASLRQYQKQVLNTTKGNQNAQISSLERSKKALEEYYKDGLKLLDKREKDVKKSLKVQENVFKDLMITYDTAIKTLSIKTGDLIQDLENQEAIVVVQSKKVEDLRKRYEDLAYTFGVTADETIKAREEFEKARVELENMANVVSEASKKIANDINKFQKTIMAALKERYSEELKLQEESINTEIKNLEKWKKESIERIRAVYDTKIKAIDDELKALDEAEKEKERQEKDNEDLDKINKLKLAIEYEHDEFNKEQLEKELEKAINERNDRLEKQSLEDKKQALKNQKDTLEEKKKNEVKNITDIFNLEKASHENRLTQLKKFYDEKTREASLQAESEKMIMDKSQKDIIDLLHSYSKEYLMAGNTLGEQLVEGFKPKIQEIKDMISSINKEIASARDNALQAQSTARSITNNNVTNNANKTNNFNVNVQDSSASRDIESTINKLAFTI
ncbi:phage tail tape measure protein [Clostridium sporogenes]